MAALDLFGETEEFWKNLVSLSLISEEEIFRALADFSGLEYVDLTGVNIEATTLATIPANFCRKEKVLPIGIRGDHLFLAMADPSNIIAIDDVASITSFIVAPKVVSPSVLQQTIDRTLRADQEIASLTEELGTDVIAEAAAEDITDDGDEAPIVRFVNLIISQAIQDRASDIHVEPGSKELKVRFRIDGVLHEMQKAERGIQAGVLSRLKIMADIDIAEKRKPQDGRMSVHHNGKNIDIRVASLPTVWGEKIVMRILDHDSTKRSLDSVGMSEANLKIFREATSRPHGMVLVTGPTGSGKALRLDTKLPTPSGWTTMGEVSIGDKLLDSRGLPTKVNGISMVNERPDLYRVTLSDGQEIYADGNHQWIVTSHSSRNSPRHGKTLRRNARQNASQAAAEVLQTMANLYEKDEFITLAELMEVVNTSDLTSYIPSKGAALSSLRYMDSPLGLITDSNGWHYAVEAPRALNDLAGRLKQRYASSKSSVLMTLSTAEMLAEGLDVNGRSNFSVPTVAGSADNSGEPRALPIDPYLLGAWLGDGHSAGGYISSGYEDYEEMSAKFHEVWGGTTELRKRGGGVLIMLTRPDKSKCIRGHEQIKGKNYCVKDNEHYGKQLTPVNASLGELIARNGLRNNKHIPEAYLTASFDQRLALLQGLMDTDGLAHKNDRSMGIDFSNPVLAQGALELVRSLGIKAKMRQQAAGDKNKSGVYLPYKDSYSIDFVTTLPVFRLKRKLARMPENVGESQKWIYIKAIEQVSPRDENYGPVRCISVDSPDASFLCEDFVVTHNSTTLYTTLDEVANPSVNVITVEDPVEKRIEGVNQVQINNKAGLTFPAALKSILRSDPDVVLIGEIRDKETAIIAVEASLTGHLVLSTLHTNGAPDALPRLVEMGVEPYLVSTAVSCVVAQRLARRLCEKCKEVWAEPDEALMEKLEFPKFDGKFSPIFKPAGCTSCSNTGYHGRLALLEVMAVTEQIERLTVDHAPSSVLRKAALEEGLVSLRQDGWRQVIAGITTIEEVLRVCA